MKYKIDDKLVCVVDFSYTIKSTFSTEFNHILTFSKGEIFNIWCIYNNGVDIIITLENINVYIDLSEKIVVENFLTKQEYRKHKLEKLNEI